MGSYNERSNHGGYFGFDLSRDIIGAPMQIIHRGWFEKNHPSPTKTNPTKTGLFNKIEDVGGYDVDWQRAKLERLREQKASQK